MSWMEIDFDVDEQLPEKADRLAEIFDALFMAAGCPQGMALFAARSSGDRVAFYLSPLAANYARELIREYHAQPCDQPPETDVDLVEGHDVGERHRLCGHP